MLTGCRYNASRAPRRQRHARWAQLFALAAALVAFVPPPAAAQAVLGIGDDAMVLPRGALRFRVMFFSTRFDDRFARNTPGREDGDIEPLAIDFTRESIGVDQFENLLPLQAGIGQLAGIPDFQLNLARTVVDLDATVRGLPLSAELGITERFSMGLVVPHVWTRNEARVFVNPDPTTANVGFNPALSSAAAVTASMAVVTQLSAAAAALQARVAACRADPSSEPGCPQIVAAGPGLIAQSMQFAAGFQQIYLGAPFVPLVNTPADLGVRQNISALRAAFGLFGINTVTVTGPYAATAQPTPLNLAEAQRILTARAFGIVAQPLETATHKGVGDIELGAKYQFLNTFGARSRFYPPDELEFRSALTTILRIGTGSPDDPNSFIDIGRGNGQSDIELRSVTDIVFGNHFWGSVSARYTFQLADHEVMRITTPDQPLAPLWRRHRVKRDLGDILEIEATPRMVLGRWFSVAGSYLYRHKAEDSYTGVIRRQNLLGQLQTLNAAVLNEETEQTEHRLTAGIAVSSLAAFAEGRFALPFELWLQRSQSVAGSGGRTPRIFQNFLTLRVYTRLFGADSPATGAGYDRLMLAVLGR